MSCKISRPPFDKILETEYGEILLDVLEREHIDIRSDCGGKGRCGKCGVFIEPGGHVKSLSDAEDPPPEVEKNGKTFRLACRTRITGDITLEIPRFYSRLSDNQSKTRIKKRFTANNGFKRMLLAAEKPLNRISCGSSNLKARIEERVFQACGERIRLDSVHAIREFSKIPADREVTLVFRGSDIVSATPGRRERSLGFAADIGTTTVVVYLCDMITGDVLAAAADTNPQRRYGEDVISRIDASNSGPAVLPVLQNLIVNKINELIKDCLEQADAACDDVDAASVTGNTVMLHLFSGLSPAGIGTYPYSPVVSTFPEFTASDLGLELKKGIPVRIMPVVSGFVGADAVAAALAADVLRSDDICLIADLGTNGELILGNKEGIWAASCATGPAFEGGHIACGTRAVPGSVRRFDIDSSGRIVYETIGTSDEFPIGVCGSGLIDAVAVLLKQGRILPSGRITGDFQDTQAGPPDRKIILIPRTSESEHEIYLTLKDIRQVQLAKAALSSGIKTLLKKSGVSKIDKTVFTGAFGAAFNPDNAAAVGMLPPEAFYGEVVSEENLAGEGAVRVLLDVAADKEAFALADQIQYVEISAEPGFADQFVADLTFPDPVEARNKQCIS